MINLGRVAVYRKAGGLAAVSQAAWNKFLDRRTVMDFRVAGIDSPLKVRVPSTDVDTFRQIFLDFEYNLNDSFKPKIIIDGGANIGLSSVYFANMYPESIVISVEPEIKNFELLTRNIAPYKNIHAVRAALWHQDGEVEIFDPGLGSWGFTAGHTISEPATASIGSVRATTIQTLMKEYRVDRVDLLKLDIEGAEYELFDNPDPWLQKVDTLVIELHDRLVSGCTERVLSKLGEFPQHWMTGENHCFSRHGHFGLLIAP